MPTLRRIHKLTWDGETGVVIAKRIQPDTARMIAMKLQSITATELDETADKTELLTNLTQELYRTIVKVLELDLEDPSDWEGIDTGDEMIDSWCDLYPGFMMRFGETIMKELFGDMAKGREDESAEDPTQPGDLPQT